MRQKVSGDMDGGCPPPQLTRGSRECQKLTSSPVGFGAEPRQRTYFGEFLPVEMLLVAAMFIIILYEILTNW